MKNFIANLIWLVSVITFLPSCQHQESSETERNTKPNVVIVITDDQGYGDLGHTGNTILRTPALDNFSQDAVNLTNYHVGTTCAPTRAGLLTGRNCNRNGVWHTIMGASILNREEVTLADVFSENGYRTGMFGKWHLGDNHPFLPHERGFEEAFYHGGGGVGQTPDYWNNDYFDDTYFRNGKPEKKVGYCTDVWFDEALQFIERRKDEPFLCYLSLNAPHGPYNVPEQYYNMYRDESGIDEIQKRFYGMITNIDDNFSKLIAKLEELGIDENTLLIFTTDNGTARGYSIDNESGTTRGYNAGMRGRKGSEYEGGHRVPMIMRWPAAGLSGGKTLSGLTAHVDMLPTLATLAGIEFSPKKTMDGSDISKYLLGKGEVPKRVLVTDTQRVPWPIKGKNSCVMEGDWRLIRGEELYNIREDPGQENDLAGQNPERVDQLNTFYESWWEDVIQETKYSVIQLGTGGVDVLTCHDAHTTDYYPPWNQQMIRAGKPMMPAPFSVEFAESGTYKFSLRRWPEESGLDLGVPVRDGVGATAYTDKIIDGNAMRFTSAHLKVGDQMIETRVNNDTGSAILEMTVEEGPTELLAYFTMENQEKSNAFYVYVEKTK